MNEPKGALNEFSALLRDVEDFRPAAPPGWLEPFLALKVMGKYGCDEASDSQLLDLVRSEKVYDLLLVFDYTTEYHERQDEVILKFHDWPVQGNDKAIFLSEGSGGWGVKDRNGKALERKLQRLRTALKRLQASLRAKLPPFPDPKSRITTSLPDVGGAVETITEAAQSRRPLRAEDDRLTAGPRSRDPVEAHQPTSDPYYSDGRSQCTGRPGDEDGGRVKGRLSSGLDQVRDVRNLSSAAKDVPAPAKAVLRGQHPVEPLLDPSSAEGGEGIEHSFAEQANPLFTRSSHSLEQIPPPHSSPATPLGINRQAESEGPCPSSSGELQEPVPNPASQEWDGDEHAHGQGPVVSSVQFPGDGVRSEEQVPSVTQTREDDQSVEDPSKRNPSGFEGPEEPPPVERRRVSPGDSESSSSAPAVTPPSLASPTWEEAHEATNITTGRVLEPVHAQEPTPDAAPCAGHPRTDEDPAKDAQPCVRAPGDVRLGCEPHASVGASNPTQVGTELEGDRPSADQDPSNAQDTRSLTGPLLAAQAKANNNAPTILAATEQLETQEREEFANRAAVYPGTDEATLPDEVESSGEEAAAATCRPQDDWQGLQDSSEGSPRAAAGDPAVAPTTLESESEFSPAMLTQEARAPSGTPLDEALGRVASLSPLLSRLEPNEEQVQEAYDELNDWNEWLGIKPKALCKMSQAEAVEKLRSWHRVFDYYLAIDPGQTYPVKEEPDRPVAITAPANRAKLAAILERLQDDCRRSLRGLGIERIDAEQGSPLITGVVERSQLASEPTDKPELHNRVFRIAPGEGGYRAGGKVFLVAYATCYEYTGPSS